MANVSAEPTSESVEGVKPKLPNGDSLNQGAAICKAMCDAEPLPLSERSATEELVPAEESESARDRDREQIKSNESASERPL